MNRASRAGITVALGAVLAACGGVTPDAGGPGSPSTSASTAPPATSVLPWPSPSTSTLPTESTTSMLTEMQRWVDDDLVPGMTAAVVSPAGSWTGAVGLDGQGVTLEPTSGMALAHLTESFVAAEALLLAERGQLDLDAPASTYVPIPQLANGVTTRQLLGHRSGVNDPAPEAYSSVFTHPNAHWSTLRALAPVPRATGSPGEAFSEAEVNYLLAGLVVEKAAGRSTAKAIDGDLWTPLGLERLAFQDEQSLAEPIAGPGEDENLPADATGRPYLPFRSIVSATAAATGAAGDAQSVARWGYALYGAEVLAPKSVEQLTDFADDDGYGLATYDLTQGEWFRFSIDGVGLAGGITGYRSALVVYPRQQLSVAVLTPSTAEAIPYVKYLVNAGGLLE
jgi:D-alanyl-D-alanine carboxypeptidase